MDVILPYLFLVLPGIMTFWVALRFNCKRHQFPLVGWQYGSAERRRKAYNKDAGKIYMEGYQLHRDKPYVITTSEGEHIVVPTSALDELRSLPDDLLGNTESLEGNYEPKYTGKIANMDLLIHLIRSDLTHGLNSINPRLAEEAESTVAVELGSCPTWESVIIRDKLLRIVATMSGNAFLGPELCHREEWLYCSINFTTDMARGVGKLKQWHTWLRPIAARFFTPEIEPIWAHRRKANEFLVPIIQARKTALKRGDIVPDDLLQRMISMAPGYKLTNEDMAQLQLTLSMVSIHTTTMSVADILSDLAIRPELVEELRQEISRVLRQGSGFGTRELSQMKLLDSVMRETSRLNPVAQQRFVREVVKPITLSDGTHLSKGSRIEAAHGAMMRDPSLYPDPEKYDPYRFLKLRTNNVPDMIGYENRDSNYQYTSVTKENMGFGFGRHACPGRFFAANEIKILLACILLNYDIRMPNGAKERYNGIVQGCVTYCDPSNKLEIRRIGGD